MTTTETSLSVSDVTQLEPTTMESVEPVVVNSDSIPSVDPMPSKRAIDYVVKVKTMASAYHDKTLSMMLGLQKGIHKFDFSRNFSSHLSRTKEILDIFETVFYAFVRDKTMLPLWEQSLDFVTLDLILDHMNSIGQTLDEINSGCDTSRVEESLGGVLRDACGRCWTLICDLTSTMNRRPIPDELARMTEEYMEKTISANEQAKKDSEVDTKFENGQELKEDGTDTTFANGQEMKEDGTDKKFENGQEMKEDRLERGSWRLEDEIDKKFEFRQWMKEDGTGTTFANGQEMKEDGTDKKLEFGQWMKEDRFERGSWRLEDEIEKKQADETNSL